MFALHPQLKKYSVTVASLALCDVRLMNNALFPWILLVPRVESAKEILDLKPSQRHLLMDEITRVSNTMQSIFSPDKLNVAALGNQVPQLHIHVIARYKGDQAWPNPVWGKGSAPYLPELRETRIQQLRLALR